MYLVYWRFRSWRRPGNGETELRILLFVEHKRFINWSSWNGECQHKLMCFVDYRSCGVAYQSRGLLKRDCRSFGVAYEIRGLLKCDYRSFRVSYESHGLLKRDYRSFGVAYESHGLLNCDHWSSVKVGLQSIYLCILKQFCEEIQNVRYPSIYINRFVRSIKFKMKWESSFGFPPGCEWFEVLGGWV